MRGTLASTTTAPKPAISASQFGRFVARFKPKSARTNLARASNLNLPQACASSLRTATSARHSNKSSLCR